MTLITRNKALFNKLINGGGGGTGAVSSVNGQTGDVVLLEKVTNDAQLKRTAGDFNTFTTKLNPKANDILLIEDSDNSNTKAKTTLTSLPISNATQNALNLKADKVDTYIKTEIDDSLNTKEDKSQKDKPSGYAGLGSDSLLSETQIKVNRLVTAGENIKIIPEGNKVKISTLETLDEYNIYIDLKNGLDANTGTILSPFQTVEHALSKIKDKGTIYIKGSGDTIGNLTIDLLNKEIAIIVVSRPDSVTFTNLKTTFKTSSIYLENCKIENLECHSGLTIYNSVITKSIKLYGANKDVKFKAVDYSSVLEKDFIISYQNTVPISESDSYLQIISDNSNTLLGGNLVIATDCVGFDIKIKNQIEDVYAGVDSILTGMTSVINDNIKNFRNRLTFIFPTINTEAKFYLVPEEGIITQETIIDIDSQMKAFINQYGYAVMKVEQYFTVENSKSIIKIPKDENQPDYLKIELKDEKYTFSKIFSLWNVNLQLADTGSAGLLSNDDYQHLIYLRSVVDISRFNSYPEHRLQSSITNQYTFNIESKMFNVNIVPPQFINKEKLNGEYTGLVICLPNLLKAARPSADYDQDVYTISLSKNNLIEGLTIKSPDKDKIKMHNGDAFVEYHNIENVNSTNSVSVSFKWNDSNPSLLKIRPVRWDLQI